MLSTTEMERRYRVIFERYHRDVYAFFRRRIDVDTAKDCTAETFLVAWRRIETVPEGDPALRWLYLVARNVLRNEYRANRRSQRLTTRLSGNGGEQETTPETVVVRREEDEEVLEALRRLSTQDQEILLLAVWEELPRDEIADVLGCTPHAASQRLHRASRRLARQLESSRSVWFSRRLAQRSQKEGRT